MGFEALLASDNYLLILQVGATVMAGLCGLILGLTYIRRCKLQQSRARAKSACGVTREKEKQLFASTGINLTLLRYLEELDKKLRFCITAYLLPEPFLCRVARTRFAGQWRDVHIRRAGLREVEAETLLEACLRLGCILGLAGFALGFVLSTSLGFLLGASLFVLGCALPFRAIRGEEKARVDALEKELPEMLEVMALGMRSGLTFERSFRLYPVYFETIFAQECSGAIKRWDLSLQSREASLQTLADSYDSLLLKRTVQSINQSLRLGTALAENLELAATEAREKFRLRNQEAAAKAPVKMMIPIGVMILPAMLLLVLGPVLLELVSGL